MTNITMRELLAAGAHFGHQTRYWNPKMAPYIFGIKHNIHIINLDKTMPLFAEALNFLSSVTSKRGKVLFVGTKPAAQKAIQEEAERCGMPYIHNRWLGGLLTNYKTVRQSIKRYKEMLEFCDSDDFAKMSKKEALMFTREITKMERNLKGIKDMGGLPDAIFVIDIGHEKIAITEARKLRIPVVGIVDTNRNPEKVDYVIPANDDSESAIRLYTQHIADAILEAKANLPIEEIMVKETSNRRPQQQKKQLPKGKKKVFTKRKPLPEIRKVGVAPEATNNEAVITETAPVETTTDTTEPKGE